jgi:NAD(P)-dependent dehydrogenase (short-subunit alcohol dehydrogenase family)
MVKTQDIGPLEGQTAIVTGGAKGYGAGIAGVLRERGATVWITGRDEKALSKAAADLDVCWLQADATVPEDWDRLFRSVVEANGSIDILVNNAGGGVRIAPLGEMTDDEIIDSIQLNLVGAALGCRRAAKVMKAQRTGIIVNISSVCQRQAWPGWSAYSAAKAGLAQLSKCLFTELREYGVRVTTVIPSWGATEFLDAAGLEARSAEDDDKCIQPGELGELVAQICELPPHLVTQDVTLWPMIQQVEPL